MNHVWELIKAAAIVAIAVMSVVIGMATMRMADDQERTADAAEKQACWSSIIAIGTAAGAEAVKPNSASC